MKTQITIKNKETCITITVEHDEPLNVSSQLEDIDKMLEKIDEKSKQSSRVIDAAGELMKEIRDTPGFQENLDTSSENIDSSLENLDTSLENQEEKPRCKWCGMTFEPRKNKNEKFCSENCRHEAKKDRDRIQKRLKSSGVSPLAARGQKITKTPKQTTERIYEGKNCERCGRFYIPTGPRQQFCKPDCKPLTPEQQAELDHTLEQLERNKNKVVI